MLKYLLQNKLQNILNNLNTNDFMIFLNLVFKC